MTYSESHIFLPEIWPKIKAVSEMTPTNGQHQQEWITKSSLCALNQPEGLYLRR